MEILRKSWQFKKVYEHGQRIVARYVVIFYLPGCSESGFGFVASKKVGKAVKRNRAKRLLREAARAIEGRFDQKGIWIVFVARKGAEEARFQDILSDITSSLEGAGLVSGES